MCEIDFLPTWYLSVQQRCRHVIIQAWITAAVIVLLSGYTFAKRLQVRSQLQITAQTEAQISMSRHQSVQANDNLECEEQMRRQQCIVTNAGLGAETARLLSDLEAAMIPGMALTRLSLEIEEQPHVNTALTRRSNSLNEPLETNRRLLVVADAVAPSEIQTATLMCNLIKINYFENVTIHSKEEKTNDGHVMRKFEVTFEINLNSPAEVKP